MVNSGIAALPLEGRKESSNDRPDVFLHAFETWTQHDLEETRARAQLHLKSCKTLTSGDSLVKNLAKVTPFNVNPYQTLDFILSGCHADLS